MFPRIVRAALLLALAAFPAAGRTVTDAAGRSVELPDKVGRILPAGPPAAVLLLTLAPDRMLGWTGALSEEAAALLPKSAAALPVIGRVTGRGGPDLQAIAALKPDLILDVGTVNPEYAALAERVQKQTGIPTLLIDGGLPRTAATYRQLGDILGAAGRGDQLAHHSERWLAEIESRVAQVPAAERPRLLLAPFPDGLGAGAAQSILAEPVAMAGAINVAPAGTGSLKPTPAELLQWNPDVLVTLRPEAYTTFRTEPSWRPMQAVATGRVYRAPDLPFGWLDDPPAVNRLLGLRWLVAKLYPRAFPEDLAGPVREFFRIYYQVQLSEAQVASLLRERP